MNALGGGGRESGARENRGSVLGRRSLVRCGLAGLLATPFASRGSAAAGAAGFGTFLAAGQEGGGEGSFLPVEDEIVLGMSAAFSGPSRGWVASFIAAPEPTSTT